MLPSGAGSDGAFAASLRRLDEFTSSLTSVPPGADSARVVHSSGGAAGGVVSEGQGYGLVLSGALAAAMPASHPRRAEVVATAHELFVGWRTMCERTDDNSCQTGHMCGDDGAHECLPSWKFDDNLAAEVSAV